MKRILTIGLFLTGLLGFPATAELSRCTITYGQVDKLGNDRVIKRESCDRADRIFELPDYSFFQFYGKRTMVFQSDPDPIPIPRIFIGDFPEGGYAWRVYGVTGDDALPTAGTCIASKGVYLDKKPPPDLYCEAGYRGADGTFNWITAQAYF
jgi:hypothetical protein